MTYILSTHQGGENNGHRNYTDWWLNATRQVYEEAKKSGQSMHVIMDKTTVQYNGMIVYEGEPGQSSVKHSAFATSEEAVTFKSKFN